MSHQISHRLLGGLFTNVKRHSVAAIARRVRVVDGVGWVVVVVWVAAFEPGKIFDITAQTLASRSRELSATRSPFTSSQTNAAAAESYAAIAEEPEEPEPTSFYSRILAH